MSELGALGDRLMTEAGVHLIDAATNDGLKGTFADTFRNNQRLTVTMYDSQSSNIRRAGQLEDGMTQALEEFRGALNPPTKAELNDLLAKAEESGDPNSPETKAYNAAKTNHDTAKSTLRQKMGSLMTDLGLIKSEAAMAQTGQRVNLGNSAFTTAANKFSPKDFHGIAGEPALGEKIGDKDTTDALSVKSDDLPTRTSSAETPEGAPKSEPATSSTASSSSGSSSGSSGGGGGAVSSGGGGGGGSLSSRANSRSSRRRGRTKDRDRDKDDRKSRSRSGSSRGGSRSGDGPVVVIGDSTTEQLKDQLMDSLVDADVGEVSIDSLGGRSMYEGDDNGMAAIRRQKDALNGEKADWFMGMGVNDAANITVGSNVSAEQRIDDAMEELSDQGTVYWPRVDVGQASAHGYNVEGSEEFNDALYEAQKKYPNLVVIDDWDPTDDEYTDGIHYNQQGMDDRVDMITNTMSQGNSSDERRH